MIYQDIELARKVGEDAQSADIPEVHKAAFRFTEKFVQRPWEFTAGDLEELRGLGLTDRDIVQWALVACMQTWWVMSADGGGIPLDGERERGDVLLHDREFYESRADRPVEMRARPVCAEGDAADGIAWVEADVDSQEYQDIMAWADGKVSRMPNLLRATSLRPECYARHRHALELLEKPQSDSLDASLHAMVRARVSVLNQCGYTQPATRAFLEEHRGGIEWDALTGPDLPEDLDPVAKTVLQFVEKLIRNSYKITASDARSFRDVGLDDEAYIDVLNTSSIQTTFDRLALALGVSAE